MLKKGLQADTDSEASANQQHQRISRGKGGGGLSTIIFSAEQCCWVFLTWWPNLEPMQVATKTSDQILNQCKGCHLVAQFATDASSATSYCIDKIVNLQMVCGAIWWPNSQHMMIKKNLLIKMIDATNWVRCASGKVHFQRWEKLPTCWCLESNGGSILSIRFLLEIRPIFFRFSSRLRPPKNKLASLVATLV